MSYWKLCKPVEIFTFPSLKPKQFGGIAHISHFESEWRKNFDGFCRIIWRFLSQKMSVRTKYFFIIRCTWTTNLEAWAPQQEYLGVRNPRNFYLGDQLWGLGTLAKMLGSLRGSLKFSLEHSLAKWDPEVLKGAFRSSKNSHCQNETKSKTFVVKMSSISMRKKSFPYQWLCKWWFGATQKWLLLVA